jgi:hypothetical protein
MTIIRSREDSRQIVVVFSMVRGTGERDSGMNREDLLGKAARTRKQAYNTKLVLEQREPAITYNMADVDCEKRGRRWELSTEREAHLFVVSLNFQSRFSAFLYYGSSPV